MDSGAGVDAGWPTCDRRDQRGDFLDTERLELFHRAPRADRLVKVGKFCAVDCGPPGNYHRDAPAGGGREQSQLVSSQPVRIVDEDQPTVRRGCRKLRGDLVKRPHWRDDPEGGAGGGRGDLVKATGATGAVDTDDNRHLWSYRTPRHTGIMPDLDDRPKSRTRRPLCPRFRRADDTRRS